MTMNRIDSRGGRAALMVAHCAGMLDLVTLPVWVGTLMSQYGFDQMQAGALATAFLLSAVASSLYFAPRFNKFHPVCAAVIGFGGAAVGFFAIAVCSDLNVLLAWHALAGAAAGCALSFTHGTIGKSANPHRLFGTSGIAIGVFALAFYGLVPRLLAEHGGEFLFRLFGCIMVVAFLVSALAFPVAAPGNNQADAGPAHAARLEPALWFVMFGIACMALVQSMVFSFVERIGVDRGFGSAAVGGVLIAIGVVNLLPAPLAMLLQRRLPAHAVLLGGPLVQAVLALVITQSGAFMPYAVATALFSCAMIFTHTFAFGMIAILDPSGRTAASTPAMLMTGAAIGPILGGTLAKVAGFGSIGIAAAGMALLALASIWRASRPQRPVGARA
jgi:predicted MFS family arabinose efflux permease